MGEGPGPMLSGHLRRRNWRLVLRDVLLLPPALLYVIVEEVFWRGAKAALGQAKRAQPVRAAERMLATWPAAAVLPLFLLPEAVSHIGGFWASALLLERKWLAACVLGGVVKGAATLLAVWIYQISEQKLLSIRWFAWGHGNVLAGRDWVLERIRPGLGLLRGTRGRIGKRFAAMRQVLAGRLGLRRRGSEPGRRDHQRR